MSLSFIPSLNVLDQRDPNQHLAFQQGQANITRTQKALRRPLGYFGFNARYPELVPIMT